MRRLPDDGDGKIGVIVGGRRVLATPRAELLGHEIDRLGLEATAGVCREALFGRERIHHVSLNAAKLVHARKDKRLLDILHRADVVNADGQSLVWASRLLGDPLPERVAGIDLMSRLLEIADAEGFGVYFLGGRAHVLEEALDKLRALYPQLRIVGSHHGYFDPDESPQICQEINSAGPDILFVAMSSPKKEYWVAENGGRLDVTLVMGIGGALDVVAGVVGRAPRWAQRVGLEWAFRLAQEPKRLWRRYLGTNALFLGIVTAALARRVLRGVSPVVSRTARSERSRSAEERR